ncbi:toxin-antitoxin system YwqK family antitoxin [Flammeovirga pacifica]|uniref:MORN repeat protein n=1 Tax=Flammeovirga pacifica TaxID=915059 RepID=A0A1S1Z2D5_FLAPC|nr:hypothetical protein [Flammeovirga pacifica]OHX67436.1 hypothetical protein NH26_14335 [Flammeovirga pacifica]
MTNNNKIFLLIGVALVITSIKLYFDFNEGFSFGNPEVAVANTSNDKVKVTYHKGTKIKKSVIRYVNGKRDGIAKTFHKNGKLHMAITYVNGEKHGVAKQFAKDGTLYKEAFYENGYVTKRKFYHDNGQVKAIETYKNGDVTTDLKEYLSTGKEKTKYPKIQVKLNDDVKSYGKVVLELTLDLRRKKTKFFIRKDETLPLETAEDWDQNLVFVKMYENRGVLEIPIPKGHYIDKVIPIYVKYSTIYGRQRVDKIDYRLKAKNM